MVAGAVSGTFYKVGTGFTFVAKQYVLDPTYGSWQTALYNGELNAWLGTMTQYTHPYYPSAPSGSLIVYDSASYVSEGLANPITSCNFCAVSSTVSGKGSVAISGTAYGEYRKQGDSITFTATPATGYKLKKMLINGNAVTTANNAYTVVIAEDISCVCYFVPTAYTVTCNEPSGGTVTFTKGGTAATVPFTAEVDDVIVCTATPNSDKMVQNFVLDGTIASGGSTGAQNFSFTIYEREDDATYNCTVSFSDRAAITDSVVGKSDGTTDDATVTTNGGTVTRGADGTFAAYVGNSYVATAATPTIFRTYGGWKNANGELVSEATSYSWTQGNSSVGIVANYVDNPLYTETLYVATSTSDYGTGGTAYVAGCRADITRPSGESKVVEGVTKYLGGSRTVSVHGAESAEAELPDNWTFSGVYVSDSDASGGTKYYKANGASSVTFDCACNAIIYAVFANGSSTTPSDVDQGNSSIASGTAAEGLYAWEGGTSSLTMKWHSKRFVASMPMNISTARVYAEGYATSGTNDTKLKCLMFQSPDSTDGNVTETVAKSQNAYRTPMRRPEKYIELEISTPHEVSQIAVATSMEALWQV